MSKPLSIACKAVGATVIIGAFVLVACLFSESSRTMYPLSPNRRPAARAAEAVKPARRMLREPARRALYSCFSGILHSSTKPSTNSTAMDSTPNDELPDSWVKKLTRNVPMTAAYLPKMSKKP